MQRCSAVLIAKVYERCIGIEIRTKVSGLAALCEMVNRVIGVGSDAAAFFACGIEQFGDFFMPAVAPSRRVSRRRRSTPGLRRRREVTSRLRDGRRALRNEADADTNTPNGSSPGLCRAAS